MLQIKLNLTPLSTNELVGLPDVGNKKFLKILHYIIAVL